MKNYILLLLLLSHTMIFAQQYSIEKIWETDTTIAVPESILPHKGQLYVSLIDGAGWEDDKQGGIGIMSKDGKIFNDKFVEGLSAPKGMAIYKNKLYVADIKELIVIKLKNGEIFKRIALPGAEALNDVTVDSKGTVYVSDSRKGNIWAVKKYIPEVYISDVKNPNGVKVVNGELYYAEGATLMKADKHKNITKIGKVSNNIDGIEPVGNGDFLLTSWPGYVYYLYADGRYDLLLETHQQGINAADLGFDQKEKIIYLPTFNGKKIVAYKLK